MADRHAPASIATPYLRRRSRLIAEPTTPRPAESVAEVRTAPRGLDLAQRRPTDAPAAGMAPSTRPKSAQSQVLLPFSAPRIGEVRELGPTHPVIRLTALQSGIGTLIVTGARSAAWESTTLICGAVNSAGDHAGSKVKTSGNRLLVDYLDTDVVVPLRHIRELRRALLIGRGDEPLGIQLFDGSSVAVAHDEAGLSFALTVMRIGNLLEVRAEPIIRSATDEEVHQQFGFVMTSQVALRDPRNR